MKYFFLLHFFFFFFTHLLSDSSYPSLNFTIENDSFVFFVDRYYTSGIQVEYQNKDLFSPISYLSKLLLFGYGKNCFKDFSCQKSLNAYSLTHLMFTPQHYKAVEPANKDRAYAGLAYFKNTNTFYFNKFIFNNQISFGNLGPLAQGQTIQGNFHKLFTFYTPKGWSHQIPNQTIYHWDFLNIITLNSYFGIPLGFRLGNWNQNFNLGIQIRFGQIASRNTFSVHSIQHSGTNPHYEDEEEEFYFFIQPRIFYESWNWSHGEQNEVGLDYKGILDDRRYTKMQRYLFFNYSLLEETNFDRSLQNFLIFNTLFNGAETLSRFEGRIFLEYVRKKNYDFEDFGVWFGVLSVFKYQDPTLYGIIRYAAFQELFTRLEISLQEKKTLLTLLYLQGEFDKTKPYSNKMKNLHGNLQLGTVYKARNIFVNFAWTFSTLDFEVQKSLPNYHIWGRLQLGIYF